jgi:hypothetical protein
MPSDGIQVIGLPFKIQVSRQSLVVSSQGRRRRRDTRLPLPRGRDETTRLSDETYCELLKCSDDLFEETRRLHEETPCSRSSIRGL